MTSLLFGYGAYMLLGCTSYCGPRFFLWYIADLKLFCCSSLWKISLEDLCGSRAYISWQNAVLCSCFLLLNDLVVSLAVRPYSSFYSKKRPYLSYDLPAEQKKLCICTSRHPKQL
ncbi:hypothetical protein GQ55_2G209900 [Panicum hallii var. hallii]|uniref:Uncharacterized protein n=1 Tax=Panicum hallii var. hallii TaxID=1504633 RepID=A0A2T7EQY0_9POAL|nr:hypothetical protein GQ55_2G209900 [Panicum hallii var. hallii]